MKADWRAGRRAGRRVGKLELQMVGQRGLKRVDCLVGRKESRKVVYSADQWVVKLVAKKVGKLELKMAAS